MIGLTPILFSTASGSRLIDILTSLGLTTNLRVALDAGDVGSYPGTGQTWFDTSAGNNDFLLGSSASPDPADPIFAGHAGTESLNEYFSFNGSQWLTLGQVNPAWVNSFHKAGAAFTIAEWVAVSGVTATTPRFGVIGDDQNASTTTAGFDFHGGSASVLRGLKVHVDNGSGAVYEQTTAAAAANNNAWNMLAVSIDATAGNVILQVNGTAESFTSQSYSSPSSSAAGSTIQIGAEGAGVFPENSGDRIGIVVMWDRALSVAEFAKFFTATRNKYGV